MPSQDQVHPGKEELWEAPAPTPPTDQERRGGAAAICSLPAPHTRAPSVAALPLCSPYSETGSRVEEQLLAPLCPLPRSRCPVWKMGEGFGLLLSSFPFPCTGSRGRAATTAACIFPKLGTIWLGALPQCSLSSSQTAGSCSLPIPQTPV